jgi:hypothetical protein
LVFLVGFISVSFSKARGVANGLVNTSRKAGTKTMNALEVSQRALDAWNRHDANAYLAVYAEGGTYETPAWTTL